MQLSDTIAVHCPFFGAPERAHTATVGGCRTRGLPPAKGTCGGCWMYPEPMTSACVILNKVCQDPELAWKEVQVGM